MKGKRHSPEQIVGKLREDPLLAEGADVDSVCRLGGLGADLHVWSYEGKHKRLRKGRDVDLPRAFERMYPN